MTLVLHGVCQHLDPQHPPHELQMATSYFLTGSQGEEVGPGGHSCQDDTLYDPSLQTRLQTRNMICRQGTNFSISTKKGKEKWEEKKNEMGKSDIFQRLQQTPP